MTRKQKPHCEIWCQQNTNIATKSIHVAGVVVMMALLLLPIGVVAKPENTTTVEINNNNGGFLATNNETSAEFAELKNILNAAADVGQIIVTPPPLPSSPPSTTNDNNNNNIVHNQHITPSINDTIAMTITMPKGIAPSTATTTSQTTTATSTVTDEQQITHSGSVANVMETSKFVASLSLSNARRDHTTSSATHTQPITTNRPYISTFAGTVRHKVAAAAHTRQYQSKHHHEHHLGPFFEGPLNTSTSALHVGVHLYTEAVLNCRVGMLKDKTVMWVRRTSDKFSLLTVGNITYSGDPRIKVTFQYPNNWRLHINPMLKEDAGLYMCQVSTHPPRVFATNVTVMPPAIRVVDEQGNEIRDRYYKIGSTIDLTCQVATKFITNNATNAPEPNILLLQHQLRQINVASTSPPTKSPPAPPPSSFSIKENEIDVEEKATHRGISSNSGGSNDNLYRKIIWKKDGENVSKDALFNLSNNDGWIISRLSILSAERQHSGIYSCSIINSTSATVDVQILNGETPAAVQHSAASKITNIYDNFQLLAPLLTVFYISC